MQEDGRPHGSSAEANLAKKAPHDCWSWGASYSFMEMQDRRPSHARIASHGLFLNQSVLIWMYLCHSCGRSSSGKIA